VAAQLYHPDHRPYIWGTKKPLIHNVANFSPRLHLHHAGGTNTALTSPAYTASAMAASTVCKPGMLTRSMAIKLKFVALENFLSA
jgi:hypothetical protein